MRNNGNDRSWSNLLDLSEDEQQSNSMALDSRNGRNDLDHVCTGSAFFSMYDWQKKSLIDGIREMQ